MDNILLETKYLSNLQSPCPKCHLVPVTDLLRWQKILIWIPMNADHFAETQVDASSEYEEAYLTVSLGVQNFHPGNKIQGGENYVVPVFFGRR